MAETKKTTKTAAPKPTKQKATVVTAGKSVEELRAELAQLHADHLDSRKSHVQGELINPRVLTTQRKNIARLHTAINSAANSAVKEDK